MEALLEAPRAGARHPMFDTQHRFDTPRGELWYCDPHKESPEKGHPVLLIHGFSRSSAFTYGGLAGHLIAAGDRPVAMDLDGHGFGPRNRFFAIESCADDYAALLESLELRDVTVVAHSMGGPVALELARRHPKLVKAVVFLASAAVWRERALDRQSRRAWLIRWLTNHPDVFLWLRDGTVTDEERIHFMRSSPASWSDCVRALRSFDARPWLGELHCAASVVVHQRDTTVVPSLQHALADGLGAPTYFVDGDHGVNHPDRYAPVLLAAIEDARARAANLPPVPRHEAPEPAPEPVSRGLLPVMALATLVLAFGLTKVAVAQPSIARALEATGSQPSWFLNAFVLAFGAPILLAGHLGDRIGRRRALRLGLLGVGLGEIVSALAWDPWSLVAGRAISGLGAALVLPVTLASLHAAFAGGSRARAIRIWAGAYSVGIATGFLFGGWLVEDAGWRWIFWAGMAAAGALLLVSHVVPRTVAAAQEPIDWEGGVLSLAGFGCLLLGVVQAPEWGWQDPATASAFCFGAALLLGFAVREAYAAHPLVDLAVLHRRPFLVAAGAIGLTYFGLMGGLVVLTPYLEGVLGYSPLQVGFGILPVAVGSVVATVAGRRLEGAMRARWRLVSGMSFIAIGLGVMVGVSISDGYTRLLVSLTIVGLGMGVVVPTGTAIIQGSLSAERAGVGSAMNDMVRLVKSMFGLALMSSLVATQYVAHRVAGPDSYLEALGAAERLGPADGEALRGVAAESYVAAMRMPLLAAACVVGAGALAVLWATHRPTVAGGRHAKEPTFEF